MDKTCSIVQDLLPLYAEDMLREETKEFVDGHLAQCEACRAELAALKADVTPAPVNAQPLRSLKKQLRRKKFTAVLLAVTLALTLAAAGFAYLTAPQYLPYSETEWTVARADGAVTAEGLADLSGVESISVNLLTPVSGTEVTSTQEPDSGKTVYFITAWRMPLDTWRGAFDKTGDAPNAHSARRTRCKARLAKWSPRARSSRSTPRTARRSTIRRTTDRTMCCSAAAGTAASFPCRGWRSAITFCYHWRFLFR